MSSWDRMGNRPIRLEEDVHWVRNECRSYEETHYSEEYDQNQGGYFGYEDQQNQWSRHEEEDTSLKEMIKEFIHVQNAIDDELEISIEVLSIQVEQNLRNDQANIQELELKFERMNEWVENQLTGQITNNIQPNPRLSNNRDDQGLKDLMKEFIRVQNAENESITNSLKVLNDKIEQGERNDQASLQELERKFERMSERFANRPTGTQSGFSYGDEEERNRNENETGADLGPIAPQHLNQLRRNGMSGATFSCVDWSSASQSNLLRRSDPVQLRNDPKVELEVENQRGNEPMVQSEDRTPNPDTTSPIKAYEPRISRQEKSLEMELEELLGTGVECVVDTSSNGLGDITLEEFERMFDISTDPIVTNKETEVEGNECLGLETKVEKETVETSDDEPHDELEVKKESNQKSKGISKKLVDLLCFLTCLEKEKILQGKDNEYEELLNFDNFTYGKPIGNGAEKDKYGGEGVYSKQWKDVSIMRETKEWNNAWAKTRMKLIVSNFAILFDDVICGNVRERDVFGSWNGEGEWGRPLFPR